MIIVGSLFVLSGILLLYQLLLPVIYAVLGSLKKQDPEKDYTPASASVIVVTRNSADRISERVKNILERKYPGIELEVIVLADKSDDETARVVSALPGIVAYCSETRKGKAPLINIGAELAKGDILVFTDDNSAFEPGAIAELLKPFYYAGTGGACGRLILKGGNPAEKIFQNMENFFKSVEGKYGAVAGAYGSIFAIRKSKFVRLPEDRMIMDDFYTTLNVISAGDKFVFCKKAACTEAYNRTGKADLQRKKRIGTGNSNALPLIEATISTSRNLLFPFFIFSHKLLRWFTAPIMFLFFITNMMLPLENSAALFLLFAVQLIIYISSAVVAAAGMKIPNPPAAWLCLFMGFIEGKDIRSRPYWDN